jgi:hypothetical protein
MPGTIYSCFLRPEELLQDHMISAAFTMAISRAPRAAECQQIGDGRQCASASLVADSAGGVCEYICKARYVDMRPQGLGRYHLHSACAACWLGASQSDRVRDRARRRRLPLLSSVRPARSDPLHTQKQRPETLKVRPTTAIERLPSLTCVHTVATAAALCCQIASWPYTSQERCRARQA